MRLQASPGECLQGTPLSEKRWPGQCENWWGWIIFWCLIGNLLCFRSQRRNRPGRECQRRKGHPAKESRINREMVGGHGQRRPSPRGPRKPARTAPSCLERPSQPGSETRFSHGQNAQSQSQSAEVRRTQMGPGTSLSNAVDSGLLMPGMSHVKHLSFCICSHVPQMVPGTSLSPNAVDSGLLMPGMSHAKHLSFSHAGYASASSRLETCPGQSAQTHPSRSATCPGQRA